MRPIAVTRRLSLFALTSSVCLMAACGLDPPPSGAQQGNADAVEAVVAAPPGLALAPREEFKLPEANGAGVRCNIETLASQSLEGVHPTLTAGRAVSVQGWYAFTPTTSAPAGASDVQPADGSAPAPVAAASKPILVISNENGIRHWTVALPELRERKDVAKAFDEPLLSKSGFDIELDLSVLSPGFYSIHLSDDAHSAESVCGLGRGFVIK